MIRSNPPSSGLAFDAEALRRGAHQGVPVGEYSVDAEALRRARQGVPTGEYHIVDRHCGRCGCRHWSAQCLLPTFPIAKT